MHRTAGVKPSLVCFNGVLHGMASAGEASRARQLLDAMHKGPLATRYVSNTVFARIRTLAYGNGRGAGAGTGARGSCLLLVFSLDICPSEDKRRYFHFTVCSRA